MNKRVNGDGVVDTRGLGKRLLRAGGRRMLRPAVLGTLLVALAVGGGSQLVPTAAANDELSSMCAAKSGGRVRYVASAAQCNTRTETAIRLPSGAPVHLCAYPPDGFVRRVAVPGACAAGETPLTLPAPGPSFFCRNASQGSFLRLVTSSAQCSGAETAAGVSVPVAVADTSTVNEDGSLSVTAAAGVLANDLDALDNPLTAALVAASGPANAASFALNADGSFTYVPAPNFNGTDSFSYTATDGTYTSTPATVTITVNPVNDAPSFGVGPNQSVAQGAGAQSVSPWATAVSPGPANESAQTLTFTVTNNTNPGLFSAGPTISPTGTLTYTPAAGAFGSATLTVVLADNGGTANGGVDTSPPQTFTITVVPPNFAPVADDDAYSVNEEAPLTVAAPGVLDGDTDADAGDTLSAVLVAGPTGGAFTLNPNGSFSYQPAPNFCGTDTFTYRASDTVAQSNTATVTITVVCVNDAPSFTKGPDQAVNEDAGAQTVNPWATAVSAGPANESAQTLTFTVTANTNPGLFSAGPAVSPAGVLTYTPAANTSGTATVTVVLNDSGGTANGGVDTSAAQTFTIAVNTFNEAPSFTKGPDQTVNEDAGAQTVNPWATAVIAGPANESTQTLTFTVTDNTNPGLFSAGPAVSPTGGLTYTPAANAFGSATVTLVLKDSGGTANGGVDTSAPQTFTITVNPVNDAPSFVVGPNQSVAQDAPAQTVSPWATAVSPGPANEAAQALTFTVTNNTNPGLFSAGPAVSPAGVLTYTPAAGASGSATATLVLADNGGTANGGVDTSPAQTFIITVVPANATPVADNDAYSVNEDAPLTVAAPGVLDGDTDADAGTTLTAVLVAGPGNAASFTLNPNGSFSYQPAPNFCGADTFTYTASDTVAQSNIATVTITVVCVNDAPSFIKGPDQTVNEDAGAQTVNPWATAVSAGPANESAQTLTFTVTANTNATLFSAGPAVSPTGELTYTPAAGASGSATITLVLKDSGGTAGGGVDTSAAQTFTITVNTVNDAPTFTKGPDQTVNEDAGAQTVNPWATAVSPGPANESAQTVAFTVTNNTNAALFSAGPAVSPTGVLTYTSAANAFGSATVTLVLKDNGGTANGGVDTSAAQTFTITVNPVNDAPVATNKAFGTAVGNTVFAVGSPPGVTGPAVSVAGTVVTGATDIDGPTPLTAVTGTITSANGGTVQLAADGSFTYLSAAGFGGTSDTFQYRVTDADGAQSAPATVTITLSGDVVWYVDDSAAAGGTGRSNAPFNALSPLQGGSDPDEAGDVIFLYSGTYPGGLALENNQKLFGQPHGLLLATVQLVPAGGTSPVVQNSAGNAVTLASGNQLQGLTLGNASGSSLAGTSFGTATIGTATAVSATNGTGQAISLATGTLNGTFATVSSSGGASGIALTGVAGTFTGSAGALSGASGAEVDIDGGNATIAYAGTVTNSAGLAVEITNRTGNSVGLSGLVSTTGAPGGVSLVNNDGSTVTFSGGVTLSTGANAAFSATDGGTVTVTGAANTLATTTGSALNVADTTIGAGGLTFRSITAGTAAAGPTNGIRLLNTGTAGGLTVSGNGGACSTAATCTGGAIQKSTVAVSLTNTVDASFDRLFIQGTTSAGVRGTLVTDFSFTNGVIDSSGTNPLGLNDQSNIAFNTVVTGTERNLSGAVTITGNRLTNAIYHGVSIFNYNGTISDLDISNNTITSSTSTGTSKGIGIQVVAFGSGSTVGSITKATINANTVTNFPSDAGVMVQCGNANSEAAPASICGAGGANVINITANTISGASATNRLGTQAILVVVNGVGTGTFNVTGNDISHTFGNSISASSFGDATLTITIHDNDVVSNGDFGAQGIGVGTSTTGGFATNSPTMNVRVTNNRVSQTDGNGILAVARDSSNGKLNITIKGNTVAAPLGGVRPGIRVDAGASAGDNDVCLDIGGTVAADQNTSAGSGGHPGGIGLRKQFADSAINAFGIEGMSATITPGVEAFVNARNPGANGTLLISATSGFTNCSTAP